MGLFEKGQGFGKWFRQELSDAEEIKELKRIVGKLEAQPVHTWDFFFDPEDFEKYRTIEQMLLGASRQFMLDPRKAGGRAYHAEYVRGFAYGALGQEPPVR